MPKVHPNADPSGRPTVLLVSSGYHLYREYLLRMISQAASSRNITVILRQADLPHAMHRLHEEFFA